MGGARPRRNRASSRCGKSRRGRSRRIRTRWERAVGPPARRRGARGAMKKTWPEQRNRRGPTRRRAASISRQLTPSPRSAIFPRPFRGFRVCQCAYGLQDPNSLHARTPRSGGTWSQRPPAQSRPSPRQPFSLPHPRRDAAWCHPTHPKQASIAPRSFHVVAAAAATTWAGHRGGARGTRSPRQTLEKSAAETQEIRTAKRGQGDGDAAALNPSAPLGATRDIGTWRFRPRPRDRKVDLEAPSVKARNFRPGSRRARRLRPCRTN